LYIKRQITEVITAEAPISRNLLCKRILSSWGIARLGQKIDARFEQLLQSLPFYKSTYEGMAFFWKDKEQMDNYSVFRVQSGRDAIDLPPEEVANAIKQTLEEQISMPMKELARLVGQLMGYAKMGANIETAMYQGIKTAVAKGYIKIENNRAKII